MLSMQITYQCNIECEHCGPYCGPKEKDWMTVDEIKDLIRQADELGTSNVIFTGGEPTLLKKNLITVLNFIRDETNVPFTRMVTNGKWAATYDVAYRKLKEWKEAGLVELNVSCGEYHQAFVPVSSVVNAFRAARDLNYRTVLLAGEFLQDGKGKYTPEMFKEAIGEDLLPPEMLSPYVAETHGMSCGAAMNYGRGADKLNEEDLIYQEYEQVQSLCSDVLTAITVHPNGNTTACCGIMVREESLLNIGNWREQKLRPMLEAAHNDVIINWIRYVGLKDMKEWLLKKDPTLKFKDKFINICDLCAQIVYNKRAQELLIEYGHERVGDIIANKVAQDAAVYEPERYVYGKTAGAHE
jgi:hypothetical protein